MKEMNEGVATSQQIKSRKKGKKTKELKVDIAGLFSFVNRSYRWMDVGVLKEKKNGIHSMGSPSPTHTVSKGLM